MGERPLAVCRAAVAACPGRVRVTESCPLQFTCAPEAPESSDGDSVDEVCATRITDPSCPNASTPEDCRAVAVGCLGRVLVSTRCPYEYTCDREDPTRSSSPEESRASLPREVAALVSRVPPSMAHPVAYRFAEGIELIGYEVRQGGAEVDALAAGSPFVVTLLWHATSSPPHRHYRLFTHVVDAEDRNRMNIDANGPLRRGDGYPPERWRAGEYILDPIEAELPADWGSAEMQLYVGVHDTDNDARLAIERGPTDGEDRLHVITLPVRGD
ncbi:MAG: hypothetical protein KC619_34750 [Myxococcales bacterium]|nr:hypothetical protein [Myxococcales bacterium]